MQPIRCSGVSAPVNPGEKDESGVDTDGVRPRRSLAGEAWSIVMVKSSAACPDHGADSFSLVFVVRILAAWAISLSTCPSWGRELALKLETFL